ncbi:hypothetical protein E2562_024659 [Oryza meyeriana var. granulata]|uniref:Uncharacterized protein n=1 Tax=Oryza meyeriana var. granulata TaxID=110450 RepID=A0A6G1EBW7_9ORYZ|nr:hypothetical protein E2562_024659 [Oryza meyeriana var. granulata]
MGRTPACPVGDGKEAAVVAIGSGYRTVELCNDVGVAFDLDAWMRWKCTGHLATSMAWPWTTYTY